MFSNNTDKAKNFLKNQLNYAKYRYYYPVLEKVYHQQYIKEANEIFEKSQLMKQKQEVKIPIFQNEKYNKVFIDYCKSELSEFGFEKNKTSLCIILGPNGIGKTTFLRSNLQKLLIQKKNKAIHPENDWYNVQTFNCGSFGILNFDTFINNFENLLIESIHKHLSKVADSPEKYLQATFNNTEIQFDAVNVIKEVLYSQYAKEFLNLYARDMIQSLINNEEITMVIPDEIKPQLSEIFNDKMMEEYTDFTDLFADIVEVLSQAYRGDKIITALNLSVALLARIEYENRPPKLKDTYHRNGIIVNSFLFDMINYLEGYHVLNRTQTQFAQNIVVLENFDNIFKGYQHDIRFYDFQDHLLLRLYSTHRERDHFPVVIETANSRFFSKELFEMMHAASNTYGFIEMYGIPEEQLQIYYNSIFSLRQINLLKKVIGGNTYTWNRLLESIILTKNKINSVSNKKKNNSADQTLSPQKVTFSDIVDLKTDFFESEYIKFKSKIQSIYLDNTLSQLLDGVDVQDRDFQSEKKQKDPTENDKVIQFYVLDTFETLIHNYGTLQLSSQYAQFRLLENHVVKALLSANVLYLRYYYSFLTFDKYVYNTFAKRYIKEVKSSMSLKERFEYFIWCRKNGIEKNSLLVYDQDNLKLVKSPENTRDLQNFKIQPEHFQLKGVDVSVDYPTITESFVNKLIRK